MKRISVIIPLYNNEKYIIHCIKSIDNQTYDNIEVIVIDDGSTDGGGMLVEKYCPKSSIKIIVKKQQNFGQSIARNVGLSLATGEYVCFIDSDDFIDKAMFSTMISKMESNNLDVIQCRYMNWYSEGDNRNVVSTTDMQPNYVVSGKYFYEKYPSLSPCDKIFKKSFLDKISFKFTEGHYAEDVFDISYIHFFSERMELLDNVFYYYRRINETSTRNEKSDGKDLKLCKDKLFIASKLYNFKTRNRWSGYVDTVIFRNIIGIFFKKVFYKKTYHKEIISYYKLLKMNSILIKVVNFETIKNVFKIANNKFIKKTD